MSNPVIQVRDLGKMYRIGKPPEAPGTRRGRIAHLLTHPIRKYRELRDTIAAEQEYWAVRHLSFQVEQGEVLGIIGRNGAGKSTLLKLLSRITAPTEGEIRIRGRVASLLEVGTGFHPELTGRENIYMNGTVLGMSKREIDRKFDEIVEFSGVDKFLDTPVKRYSSGMKVRLGFAVAAHLEPEVLIVDEVLAVGDFAFQEKCMGKMRDVASHGRTVVFVSHSMGAVAELCDRCIALTAGSITDEGDTLRVVEKYLAVAAAEGRVDLNDYQLERSGDGPMRVKFLELLDEHGQVQSTFAHGDSLRCRIGIDGSIGKGCIIGFSIRDARGQVVLHLNNTDDQTRIVLPCSNSIIEMELRQNILNDGRYYATVWLGDELNILHDRIGNCLSFVVQSPASGAIRSQGIVRIPAYWQVQ